MSVESKVAKAAIISTTFFAVPRISSILIERVNHRREQANRRREEEKENMLEFQRARKLAQDSYNSGDFGLPLAERIF
jgi:hypothetical protein